MPNQPATPARTFRLSDETIADLDRTAEALGAINRSDALRRVIEAVEKATSALGKFGSDLVPLEALAAADQKAMLNIYMPTDEADRRLAAALDAAQPFIARAERKLVLEDVVERLRGFKVDPAVVMHFVNLAQAADR